MAGPQRLRAAFISCGVALLAGYFGLSRIQLNGSKTVNGHVEWSINSRWFFFGALVLAAASLALTLWNWRKARSRLVADP
jgi:protein-S-isoprenylcysteine O-methyltransferase Ste14